MEDSRIGVRYAKALYLLGKERDTLKKLYEDVASIYPVIKSSKELQAFLNNPVIKDKQKIETIKKVFEKQINKDLLDLFYLMINNKRGGYIAMALLSFTDLYREAHNIKKATLTTSAPLSRELFEQVNQKLAKSLHAEIEIEGNTDESLLGGFVLKINNQQYDASIKRKLANIKKELLHSTTSN